MAAKGIADMGAILTYAAGAVVTSYPTNPAATNVFYIGAGVNCSIWVKFVTDGASNFTSYNVKLVDSYDGSAGSWIDNEITQSDTGTTSNAPQVSLSVGATSWKKFQTTNTRLSPGGVSVFLKANGGVVSAADACTVYLVTF